MRILTVVFASGTTIQVPVNEAEFFGEPEEVKIDGEIQRNPRAGMLNGYKIDTEGLGVPLLWFDVGEITSIMVQEEPAVKTKEPSVREVDEPILSRPRSRARGGGRKSTK